MTDFAQKVALVTGGGSGIGRAACQRMAAEGASVVVVDRDEATARRTVELIEAAGGKAIAVAADISSAADNAAMFDAAEAAFGGVDAAFLNAGILQPYGPFEKLSLETFDRVISVNLRGTFLGVQQAQARLRPGGACVVTASGAGVIGFAEAAAYSMSKHGVLGLVRSAAASFAARRGVPQAAHQHKTDEKPQAPTQATFEQLLIDGGVPQEKRAELLRDGS